MRNYSLILFLCFMLLSKLSFGQTDFGFVLSKYQNSFEELMDYRGIDYTTEEQNVELVKEAATNYTPLLFYHHSNDTLYCWLVVNLDIIYFDFSIVSKEELYQLEKELKASLGIYNSLTQRGASLGNSATDSERNIHSEVINTLFPGIIQKQIKTLEYLTILPVLNINAFPFYLIHFEDEQKYLIDYTCINFAKSLDDFVSKSNQFNESFGSYENAEMEFDPLKPLIIGNPKAGISCSDDYIVLPGAAKEAMEVAATFRVSPFLNINATRENILSNYKESDFLYFATHGIANPNNPMDSSFLLLAADQQGNCDFLTSREIQELELYEDLVILSACQTGLGRSMDAGTVGIARAFLNAGAWNVIMSLWNLDDEASVELMKIYLEELQKSTPFFPSQNLRNAMLRFRKTHPNPAHWGPFVSFGSPYPVNTKTHLLTPE
jgi:CHAT domain-containing protein